MEAADTSEPHIPELEAPMDRVRNGLQQFRQWVRSSPWHVVAVGVVAFLAVFTGIAFAMVVGGARQPEIAGQPSSSPSASASSSNDSSATATPSPSDSAAPSETPEATSEATARPTPTPSPTPTPTPRGAYGGGPVEFDITGEWSRLSAMPGGDQFLTADSLELPDGRLAVFRWNNVSLDHPEEEVVIYNREPGGWQVVQFTGDRVPVGTDSPFVLGGDGRIYTYDTVIDVSGNSWSAEPIGLIKETDTWAGTGLTAGVDGRIYRRAEDVGGSVTELIAYDPLTGAFSRTSRITGLFDPVYAGHDDTLGLLGSRISGIISYDIGADEWSSPVPISAFDAFDWRHTAERADGSIYLTGLDPDIPQLWALDPDDGTQRSVELPTGITSWDVDLLWTNDDHLFAFGHDDAWIFSPDD
jgi:hypothetical protein